MAGGEGSEVSVFSGLRRQGGRWLRRQRAAGGERHCPLCECDISSFLPHGNPVREQSVCPVCFSRERHRLAWSYLSRNLPNGGDGIRLLHLAPEPELARRLRAKNGIDYVCGDINPIDGIRLDVQSLPFKDGCFDYVYCSHVLNMVSDDVAALREIGRVLRPDGEALLQVPLADEPRTREAKPGWTIEQRLAEFRDPLMWRRHGADVVARLEDSGLQVERLDWAARLEAGQFEREGLIREDLLLCRRRESS
jgi:SAM-dependent methyltransferase